MKPDEILFLRTVASERPKQERYGPFADAVGVQLGLHPKRAAYLLEKWSNKGWWECGVSLRSGWLTEAGLAKARELEGVKP